MKTHNGYVYCIHCNITGDNYVGSTRNTINIRMRSHKCKANKCQSKHIIENNERINENLRNHRKYQQTWGDCIAKRHRDTPHNLLLIDTNIFD